MPRSAATRRRCSTARSTPCRRGCSRPPWLAARAICACGVYEREESREGSVKGGTAKRSPGTSPRAASTPRLRQNRTPRLTLVNAQQQGALRGAEGRGGARAQARRKAVEGSRGNPSPSPQPRPTSLPPTARSTGARQSGTHQQDTRSGAGGGGLCWGGTAACPRGEGSIRKLWSGGEGWSQPPPAALMW